MSNTYPPGWAKNATTPAPPSETIFSQDYTPDWPSIPEQYNWVAVDDNWEAYAYKTKPIPSTHLWTHDDDECLELGFINPQPGGHWKTMIYERPKQD